jgi:hypothetical protein
VEVHRRRVSQTFLCATDRRVVAVVGDVRPPRELPWLRASEVEALADLLVERFSLPASPRRPARRRAAASRR